VGNLTAVEDPPIGVIGKVERKNRKSGKKE